MSAVKPVDSSPSAMRATLDGVVERAGEVILGKDRRIRLSLACLLARGHLLIEDLPGLGKTTLAHVLARLLGLEFQRIQFTSDMLPADILGVSVFERDSGAFRFHPGPIFSQLVLADEVNRATPKAQSALLEAMEERQVTIEGKTRALPDPFFVVATQNPRHQIGTFPLPESQLDRFLLCIDMGYPEKTAERALLKGRARREVLADMQPALAPDVLAGLQARVDAVLASDALLDYVQALLAYSRTSGHFRYGLSPRAGLAMLHCARAWALMDGREHVLPEDIQAVLPSVVRHRLKLVSDESEYSHQEVASELLTQVPIP